MKPSNTPLRYPGGKTWLLEYVKKFISFHELRPRAIIEPYGGSASVSVGLLRSNMVQEAFVSEKDPLVVAFWKAVLYRNEEFIEKVTSLNITLDTWISFRKFLVKESTRFDEMDLAVAFLFFNRTNFSGIIKGGPLGGKKQQSAYKLDCRFNRKKIIERIKRLRSLEGRLHVVECDGLSFMQEMVKPKTENLFFYVDPPYFGAGRDLYRFYFSEVDHQKLSDFLISLDFPWLLSYDDAVFIRTLYQENNRFPVFTDYQSGHLKRGVQELLISNYLIPPIHPEMKKELVSDKQATVISELS